MVTVLQCQCYCYGVSLSLSLVRGAAMRFWPLLAVALASAADRDYFSSTSRLYELEAGLVTSLQSDTRDSLAALTNIPAQLPPPAGQYDGVLHGLFLLQDAFNLNISELARGRVTAPGLGPPLPSSHVAKLGYQDQDGYHRAVQWFQVGQDQDWLPPLAFSSLNTLVYSVILLLFYGFDHK